MNKRVHLLIYGDVIGVGFRAWTYSNAKELELTGWVKNAGLGIVEAVFEGSEVKIKEMIDRCHRGPEVAWVKNVEEKWEYVEEEFETFEIRF